MLFIHSSLKKYGYILMMGFSLQAAGYENFRTAIYCRVYEVQKMADSTWLRDSFDVMSRFVKPDKIYLETHRDRVVIDEETLVRVKQFFEDRGIPTSGGITITVNESNRFQTYCYTHPEHRNKLKEVVEFTVRHFNEVMLDDFFFTSCKCESCIRAKGRRSWTEFRLDLLRNAAESLILEPAKKINPDVKVIIKYPNWYEHFQGLGFDLENNSQVFDQIYTGTETRDPYFSNQHLQNYQSYLIFRYFENIRPGGNAGGWVDTGGIRFMDRYAEQLWLTLFAGAPEITLFDYRQMMNPISPNLRAQWQGSGTSFDFDAMLASNESSENSTMALAAGYSLEIADETLEFLGKPVGVRSYKPYHSTGEDFLHNYLGMAGIPIELMPEFPGDAATVLLTESAAYDPSIVDRIKTKLRQGGTVIITSGLLRELEAKGIRQIAELEYTDRKALVKDFIVGWGPAVQSKEAMMMPQIAYLTNDSWEEISALDGTAGWPVLHSADYAKGKLYVLAVPDNFADLYNLPQEVLKRIRQTLMRDIPVRMDGPAQIALFVYDNQTFIVESFLDEGSDIDLVTNPGILNLTDLMSGETLAGEALTPQRFRGILFGEEKVRFRTRIGPHSFRVFRAN